MKIIDESAVNNKIEEAKGLLTLSEFRREVGIPLILAKKLIVWGEIEAEKAVDGTFRVAASEVLVVQDLIKNPMTRLKLFVKALGPGLITGASDDDPGGIGTYSSVGAKFGLAILWMAAWLLPIMLAVQEACARIGIVTNKGLAEVLRKHYGKKVVMGAVILLIIANVANIGADLGAMAASIVMLTQVNFYAAVVFFAIVIIALEILVGYHIYVKFLKWLTLSVFAYIITGFIVHPNWLEVVKNSFVPQIYFNKEYIFAMVAVFGTTITPYLFFWQASEEVEECHKDGKFKKSLVHGRIGKMRTDVGFGMLLANVVFFFIVLTTAQVLFKNGITSIDSAEQAAAALRPFAGDYAFFLFALGIIGTGFLAIPILAASGAYALAELMKWHESLELKFSQAKGFYMVIVVSIIVGSLLNFLHINPIAALYYSAFLNGIIAVPLLIVIMVVGNDPKIMGQETHPAWVKFFGWLAIVFMIIAVVASVYLSFIK
ncbi:MAG: divalent metal cation transporter [Parcubacteria group bacterium]|jgi:NRAMP (natural resistance-associated macrophage protein)-like metal ion transporter